MGAANTAVARARALEQLRPPGSLKTSHEKKKKNVKESSPSGSLNTRKPATGNDVVVVFIVNTTTGLERREKNEVCTRHTHTHAVDFVTLRAVQGEPRASRAEFTGQCSSSDLRNRRAIPT